MLKILIAVFCLATSLFADVVTTYTCSAGAGTTGNLISMSASGSTDSGGCSASNPGFGQASASFFASVQIVGSNAISGSMIGTSYSQADYSCPTSPPSTFDECEAYVELQASQTISFQTAGPVRYGLVEFSEENNNTIFDGSTGNDVVESDDGLSLTGLTGGLNVIPFELGVAASIKTTLYMDLEGNSGIYLFGDNSPTPYLSYNVAFYEADGVTPVAILLPEPSTWILGGLPLLLLLSARFLLRRKSAELNENRPVSQLGRTS